MRSWTRRELLEALAASGLLAACSPLVNDSALPVPAGLLELVVAIEEAPDPEALVVVLGDAFRAGHTLDVLHRAGLVACCRQLDFAQVGFHAHPLWTLYSARAIASRGTATDARLALMHALDRFKHYQADVGRPENAGPFDDSLLMGAAEAADALPIALESFDYETADAAAVSLVRADDLISLNTGLVRGGLRSVGSIGHAMIHVSQTLRTAIPVGVDEAVVRTLVYGLCTEAEQDASYLAPWDSNRDRADQLTVGWDSGTYDASEVAPLLAQIRVGGAEACSDVALQHLQAGGSLRALREAALARASELTLTHRDEPGVFPGLHTTTGVDACIWLADAIFDDRTRRVAALQMAALVGSNHVDAVDRTGGEGQAVRLDELAASTGATADDVMAALDSDRVGAVQALLGLADPLELVTAQRTLALSKATDDHHFKLPVAAWERAEAAQGAVRGWILAAALGWGNAPSDDDWELLEAAREQLA